MKTNRRIRFALASLLLATMACSLLPFGKDEAPEATSEAVSQPAESSSDSGQTSFELAPLDVSRLWDKDQFSSLRARMVIDYDLDVEGAPTKVSMTMLMEATADPSASHLSMTQEGMDLGEFGAFNIEMYMMNDQIYMSGFFGDSWMVLPDEESMDFMDEFLVDPEEIVDVPPQAWRAPDPEMVNGVSSWHYKFNQDDMMEFAPESLDDLDFESMVVDMWIAVDGGYMVRMENEMEGINAAASEDMGAPEGEIHQMHFVYDVLEINTPITIELPPEAANAEPFDPFSMMGGMDEVDDEMLEYVPLPEDAEISFSFEGMFEAQTSWSFDETKDWMLAELATLGWVVDNEFGSAADGYMVFFNMGDKSLTLTLTENESGTSIVAMMN